MDIERAFGPHIGAEAHTRFDEAIAALAKRQHGVVARAQLVGLGMGRRAIGHRLERGRLHVIRGVYAVGHTVLSRHGIWTAAVLAVGPGAVLSHRSAAALWGIRDTTRGATELIAPRQCRRPGIDVHRTALPADETTVEQGIPVTTPARTLLDLAEHLTPHQLERAVKEAEYRRLGSALSLDALLTRHRGRRWTSALKAIVDGGRVGQGRTRSELEIEFLAFVDAHALPRPLVNEAIGPYTVDALWPGDRVVVELDSRQAHATTSAFEHDRARDRDLLTHGYKVLRITSRQLQLDRETIATQLRCLLATRTNAAVPRAQRVRRPSRPTIAGGSASDALTSRGPSSP